MIRKLLMSTAIAVSVSLGACTTTQVTDFLKLVQADTATACQFVPTIDTILAVASALGIPATAIVGPLVVVGGAIDTVAHAICSQVPPPASARFRALPTRGGPAATVGKVNGVVINGWRV